ncbi:MAG: hypothetical protein PHU81_09310 [Acidobacteriota bacterium]|nr:hypothetical protein [Acidobacteriota bacterium]
MKKKFFWTVFVLVVFGLNGPALRSQTQEVPTQFGTYEDFLTYFNHNIQILPPTISPPELIYNVSDWYDLTIDDIRYKGRFISAELVEYNVGGIEDIKYVCSVGAGQQYTTTTTIQTCSAVKMSSNISFSFGLASIIGLSLGLQREITKQTCYTIVEGYTYQFPDFCSGYNSASFYTGIGFDLYKITLEIAPYQVIPPEEMLLRCLRACMKLPAEMVESCREECYQQYGSSSGYEEPNFNEISTYVTYIYRPAQRNWVKCFNY